VALAAASRLARSPISDFSGAFARLRVLVAFVFILWIRIAFAMLDHHKPGFEAGGRDPGGAVDTEAMLPVRGSRAESVAGQRFLLPGNFENVAAR